MDLSKTLDIPRLNNYELLSEIATLGFLTGNEVGKKSLEVLSGMKILHELYNRVNEDENKLAVLRAQTAVRLSDYIKKHPRASDDQLRKEVQKEINIFASHAAQIIN